MLLNQLTNPGFETCTGSTGVADGWRAYIPTQTYSDLQVVASTLQEGRAQKVEVSGLVGGQQAYLDQFVAIDPGCEYELSGYFKAELLEHAEVQLRIDFYDVNDQLLLGGPVALRTPTAGYVRLQNIKQPPLTAIRARVMIALHALTDGAAGTFFADALSLRKTTAEIVNADFEQYDGIDGIADSWRLNKDPNAEAALEVVSAPVATGRSAQKVAGSRLASAGYVDVYQTLAADENLPCQISGSFLVERLDNAKVQLYVDYYDAEGSWISGKSLAELLAPTDGYVELSARAVTPPRTRFQRVYGLLRGTGENGTGVFYLDRLHVVIPDEPVIQPIVDLIPDMANNTAPRGTAWAEPASNLAFRAFDKGSSGWLTSKTTTGVIGYDFQTPAVVRSYTLMVSATSSTYLKRAPRDWTFEAFDGAEWVVLDRQAGIANWQTGAVRAFPIDNTRSYPKYRLNVTANNGYPTALEIDEFGMNGYFGKPVPPSGLWNSLAGGGLIDLKWQTQNGVSEYRIYQDGIWVMSVPGDATSARVSNLSNNRLYRFTVTAANGSGESAPSAPVLAVPYSNPELLVPDMSANTRPLGRAFADKNDKNAYLLFNRSGSTSWRSTDKQGQVGYDFGTPAVVREYIIYASDTNTGSAPKNWTFEAFDGTEWKVLDRRSNITDWSQLSYVRPFAVKNETPYAQYRLNITDCNSVYLSFNELRLIGSYAIPSAPQGLTNTNSASGSVTLSWQGVNGATAYHLYQDGVKVLTIPNVSPLSELTKTISGLTNVRLYRFSVTAENASGESLPSPQVLAMPYDPNSHQLIPDMYSNTKPSGVASASENDGGAYLLFDRSSYSWTSTKQTGIAGYAFPAPVIVRQYIVQGPGTRTRAPKSWTLEGFDGQNWVAIDRQDAVGDWAFSERKLYAIENQTAYSQYRLNVTENNGDAGLEIVELQLIGSK